MPHMIIGKTRHREIAVIITILPPQIHLALPLRCFHKILRQELTLFVEIVRCALLYSLSISVVHSKRDHTCEPKQRGRDVKHLQHQSKYPISPPSTLSPTPSHHALSTTPGSPLQNTLQKPSSPTDTPLGYKSAQTHWQIYTCQDSSKTASRHHARPCYVQKC